MSLVKAAPSKGSHEALAIWMPDWKAASSSRPAVSSGCSVLYCSKYLVAAPCKPGLVVQRRHIHCVPLKGVLPQGAGLQIDEVLDVENLEAL